MATATKLQAAQRAAGSAHDLEMLGTNNVDVATHMHTMATTGKLATGSHTDRVIRRTAMPASWQVDARTRPVPHGLVARTVATAVRGGCRIAVPAQMAAN